jgi:hypothetical protein
MVLPLGHAQGLRAGRRLRVRERWMLAGVVGVSLALLVAVVIAFGVSGPGSAHGCIHAVVPAPTGAQEINQCGGAARATCASVGKSGGFTPAAARSVTAECRKAGLAVGR